jgi:palmitoyltransferase
MELAQLAVPSVYLLITFLAYTSQWLLLHLDPEPVKRGELIRFNVLLVCLLISYTRSVLVDPGWAVVGKGDGEQEKEIDADGDEKGKGGEEARRSRKWCRKCNAMKPPRAHHCRTCKRFVMFPSSLPHSFSTLLTKFSPKLLRSMDSLTSRDHH